MRKSSSVAAWWLNREAPEPPRASSPSPVLRRNDRPLVLLLAFGFVLGLSVGTQYVAWRFAFHGNLGIPLVAPNDRLLRLLRALSILVCGLALSSVTLPQSRRAFPVLVFVSVLLAASSLGPL